MDFDTYLATNSKDWDRLAELTKGGRKKLVKRNAVELREITELYQKASASLSYVRSHYNDPSLTAYLSLIVNRAGNLIYSTHKRSWRNAAWFFTTTFPAALWHLRKALLVSALLLFVPAIAGGVWIANSPDAQLAALPAELRDQYINHDFEEYYESEHASEFATDVYTNNAQVAIMAFAGGALLGIPTVFSLVFNGFNVGVAAGEFSSVHQLGKFFGLILPHGLLELTCVVVAGATGLQVAWTIIAPGKRSRGKALGTEGRRAGALLFGTVLTLAIAGFIEGFVSGQPWPTWIRVGIGVTVEAAFIIYMIGAGRYAASRGFTGELGEIDAQGWAERTRQQAQ